LADYEAHMALPQVGQAELLANVLADAVRWHAPRSVAVLGCAAATASIACRRARGSSASMSTRTTSPPPRARHGARAGLELFVGDVTADELPFAARGACVRGLLFEYVEPAVALRRVATKLLPRAGSWSCCSFLAPRKARYAVALHELAALAPSMRLVPPAALTRAALAEATIGRRRRSDRERRQTIAVQTYRRS